MKRKTELQLSEFDKNKAGISDTNTVVIIFSQKLTLPLQRNRIAL
jgi:hypothetical protein